MDTKFEKAIAKLVERMQPGGMTPEEQEAYAQFLEIASKMPAEALRDLTQADGVCGECHGDPEGGVRGSPPRPSGERRLKEKRL